ncbi:hypothetical protein DUNSADRAFT_2263 [Dunaliella salina]|uniref:PKD/REJ-like domain-containing protein n=1 Tax=Dunaliella salina TaxID=3046 RepID=A0ABQ7FWJ1_DUNSA|nr:hypothetical protein DUNSADRAFT_2263 [Dunaliella salina]|eukprot:KAF5826719.1 hypothetical protein DUNSADRAFT_2263 [Dunaliella salina]
MLDGQSSPTDPRSELLDTSPLESACLQGRGSFSTDASCAQMIIRANSEDLLAFRAGALCNIIGSCSPSDECRIESSSGGAQPEALDFCTVDGTVNGEIVGTKAAKLEEGTCFQDSDCPGKAMCSTWTEDVSRVLECQANGLDLVKAQGTCKNPCETVSVQDFLQSMNSAYEACQSQDDCNEGALCEQASDSCRIYTCNSETGEVIANACNRTCQAATLELAAAQFSNDGDLIIDLTSNAKAYAGSCSSIFDASSVALLGNSAECLAEDKELYIMLKGDATILEGDVLRLTPSQSSLVTKVDSISFQGSTRPVSMCSSCEAPQAALTGPTTLNEQCKPSSDGEVVFSGASSTGPGSRPFASVLWSMGSEPDGGIPTSFLDALSDANNRESLNLDLDSGVVNELAAGDYTLKLTVTSFLGTSSSAEHSFTKQSGNTSPSVSIAANGAFYSRGISLEVSVSTQDVLCSGNQVTFVWSCGLHRLGQKEECNILDGVGVRSRSSLYIPSTTLAGSGIQVGDRLTFNLSASYVGVGSSTNVSQTVEVLGEELIARLEGPSGDVQMGGKDEMIVFSAQNSEDPSDPSDRMEPMRYKFHCEREDELAPCFKDIDYFGTVSGFQWMLNSSMFAEPDVQHFVHVTVAKGTEGVNRRTASATKVVIPRAREVIHTEIARFCPGDTSCSSRHVSINPLALSVLVRLENIRNVPSSLKYRWSYPQDQAQRLGVQLDSSNTRGGVESEDIIILPGPAQPYSGRLIVQCQVTLPDGRQTASAISILSRGPPVCASTEGCLRIPRNESTFPGNAFVAHAVGWSSEGPLRFEFGYMSEDGVYRIVQPMSQKMTFTYKAEVGAHRPYVCAYDGSGGKTCTESSFVLREPATDYTAQQLMSTLRGVNFAALLGTGDDNAIWEAAQDIISHLSAASFELDPEDQAFVESLLEDASAAVESISRSEVADARVGVNTINTENSLVRQGMRVNATRMLQNTAVGLRLLEVAQDFGLDVETAENAMENSYSALTSSDARARSLLAPLGTQETARSMDSIFASIGRQLARITLPGSSNHIQRGNTTLATLRTSSSESLSTATISPTGSRHGPRVQFLGAGFPSWCSSDNECSKQDSLAAVVTYLQDPFPYIDATSNLNEVLQERNATDVEVVSGLLEVQLGYEGKANQLLCDEGNTVGCQLQLQLPLQNTYNASKSHACVRIVPSGEAYQAVRSTASDAAPTFNGELPTGSCTNSGLGKHVIIQYTPPPTKEIKPEIKPRPGRPERTRSKAFNVYVVVELAVDEAAQEGPSSSIAKEQLMRDMSQALAVGLYRLDSSLMGDGLGQMCTDCVKAEGLEVLDSGSSLVILAVYLPDDTLDESKEAFKGEISAASVVDLLSESEFVDKVVGVSLQQKDDDGNPVDLQPEPSPGSGRQGDGNDGSSSESALIGGAVGGAVGGALFIAIVAASSLYVCTRRKKLGGGKKREECIYNPNPLYKQGSQATVYIERMCTPFNQPGGYYAGHETASVMPHPDLEEGQNNQECNTSRV